MTHKSASEGSARFVHCIGIGGIGVSAIAKWFLSKGAAVSGSDLNESIITKELASRGVSITIGPHSADHIPSETDFIVYSPAAEQDNPELRAAHAKNIPVYSYPEVLGMLMEGTYGIAISGTHGKSTTTSIIGLILTEAGMDPTVVVGSRVHLFDGNIRIGNSQYFIAEACEWKAHMMHVHPRGAVLTNIDADHLDYYQSIDKIAEAFREFFCKVPENGFAVLPAGSPYTDSLRACVSAPVYTFGLEKESDFYAHSINVAHERQEFRIRYRGEDLGFFFLRIPGTFNIENALAACAVAHHLNIPVSIIRKVFETFPGIWRRFERVGEYKGALVLSDYAHHPTAVSKTIRAAREFFPERRIVAVFQPHHRHRTRVLFNLFVTAFDEADEIIINEIYDVAGRENEEDKSISSELLAEHIRRRGKRVIFSPDLSQTKQLISECARPGDALLIMGAGDIDSVSRDIAHG